MLSASAGFMSAATATVRNPSARCTVIWSDSEIDTSIVVSANETNRIDNKAQVGDSVSLSSQKWAHLDGVIKADGTWHPMPGNPTDPVAEQMGWYGNQACPSSGYFTFTNPMLTIEFNSRPIDSLYVSGDSVYGEYPIGFEICLYNGASLEHTETILDNTSVRWFKQITSLPSIDKMTLEILQWSTGYRVVKITEFYTSFVRTYDDTEIMSMRVLEEKELSEGSLPDGNISINELDIVFNNIDDKFTPGNTSSELVNVIKPGRILYPELGFTLSDGTIEYVPMGVFYSGDWKVPEMGTYASTTGRDTLERLRKLSCQVSEIYQDTNLYTLVINFLTEAKRSIPDLEWNVDTDLQNFTIEWAWFPVQSYFQIIKDIAVACIGRAYMTRDNVLKIEGLQI